MVDLEKIGEGIAQHEGLTIQTAIFKLHKSFLLFVTDQADFGIGTVNFSIPPSGISTQAINSPFNLFGLKNTLLSSVIGKNATTHLKAPVLSLVYLLSTDFKEEQLLKTAMEAVLQAIQKVKTVLKQT
jgi:hypothetical protein